LWIKNIKTNEQVNPEKCDVEKYRKLAQYCEEAKLYEEAK